MADRGFDIEESITVYCAEVKIPSFTKGKRLLSSLDVEKSRLIASVRIHWERPKQYSILQGILPLQSWTYNQWICYIFCRISHHKQNWGKLLYI